MKENVGEESSNTTPLTFPKRERSHPIIQEEDKDVTVMVM
jgi:hypothetical protein